MTDVLAWANAECGAIPDSEFRVVAAEHLDSADPRSVRWLADELAARVPLQSADLPSPAHRRALREAVELRLLAEIEDLRDERALAAMPA